MTIEVAPRRTRLSLQVALEISSLMTRRGITGQALSRKLNVAQSWISDRLRGNRAITVDDLERLADALDVNVLDLFPRTQSRSTEEVLATIGLDQFRQSRTLTRRRRRVTEEYPRRPGDNRPAAGPGAPPTPRRTVRVAA